MNRLSYKGENNFVQKKRFNHPRGGKARRSRLEWGKAKPYLKCEKRNKKCQGKQKKKHKKSAKTIWKKLDDN